MRAKPRTYYFSVADRRAYAKSFLLSKHMPKYDNHLLLFLADIYDNKLYYPLELVMRYAPILRAYKLFLRKGYIVEAESPDPMYRELVKYVKRYHRGDAVVFKGVLGRHDIVVERVPYEKMQLLPLYILVNAYREIRPEDIAGSLGLNERYAWRSMRLLFRAKYLRCRGKKCVAVDRDVVIKSYEALNKKLDGVKAYMEKILLFIDPEKKISIEELLKRYGRILVFRIGSLDRAIRTAESVKKYALFMNRRDVADTVERFVEVLRKYYLIGFNSLSGRANIVSEIRLLADGLEYYRCLDNVRKRIDRYIRSYCRDHGVVGAVLRHHGVCGGDVEALRYIAWVLGINIRDRCDEITVEEQGEDAGADA